MSTKRTKKTTNEAVNEKPIENETHESAQPKITETIPEKLYNDICDVTEETANKLIDVAVKNDAPILSVFDFYISFFSFIIDSVKKKQAEKAQDEKPTEDKPEEENN